MQLRLNRFASDNDSTIGMLLIDNVPACYILEDQHATKKLWGEMRIPAGTYEVSLRREGSFHARYSKKFSDFHLGMLCIHNAPDWKILQGDIVFQYVLIHIGNTDDDTAGCLLTGSTVMRSNKWSVLQSTDAYKRVYKKIAQAIYSGEKCLLTIRDMDLELDKFLKE